MNNQELQRLKRHSQGKRKASAYSRAMRQIRDQRPVEVQILMGPELYPANCNSLLLLK